MLNETRYHQGFVGIIVFFPFFFFPGFNLQFNQLLHWHFFLFVQIIRCILILVAFLFLVNIDTRSSYAQWTLQRTSFSATPTMSCEVCKRTYVIIRQENSFMKQCLFGMSSWLMESEITSRIRYGQLHWCMASLNRYAIWNLIS